MLQSNQWVLEWSDNSNQFQSFLSELSWAKIESKTQSKFFRFGRRRRGRRRKEKKNKFEFQTKTSKMTREWKTLNYQNLNILLFNMKCSWPFLYVFNVLKIVTFELYPVLRIDNQTKYIPLSFSLHSSPDWTIEHGIEWGFNAQMLFFTLKRWHSPTFHRIISLLWYGWVHSIQHRKNALRLHMKQI